MQRKTSLAYIAVLILFLGSALAVVYAAYSTSIIYSKFNSTDWYTEPLDKNYTAVTIDIKCYLTFNTTGTPAAKVAFMNETTNVKGIIVLFFKDNTEKIYYNDGIVEVQIATGTWAKGNTTRIVLSSKKITIYDYYGIKDSQTKILDGFSFDEEFANVRAKGATAYTATDGYVQVDVNAGAAGTSGIIMDWIPSILSLMMLGIAIGMISKFVR